jgi:hypothetical protein
LANDEEEMGFFFFFSGDDDDWRWWSAGWIWPARDEEETGFVFFFLAIMVTGEGVLPVGFAAASGFVFCFHLKFVHFS